MIRALKEAETTPEFESFVKCLDSGPLYKDLERLTSRVDTHRSDQPKHVRNDRKPKPNKGQWRITTARDAAHRFFINSGTYLKLWLNSALDESKLIEAFQTPDNVRTSDYLRLLVFDGFVLYGDGKRITHVALPRGDLRLYRREELQDLLRLPQSAWHDAISKTLANELADHYLLTIKEREPYRGRVGIWSGDRLLTRVSWEDIGDITREDDIDLYGPLFLCLGDDANLAEELRIRTNVFDGVPVLRKVRNDYLPWDQFDEAGNPHPKSTIQDIGNEGVKLKTVYEAWSIVNGLDKDGFLRLPTQTFTRAIMALHKSRREDSRLYEVFVSLVTAIESVLSAGSRSELTYKTAVRGSALLAYDGKERLKAFRIINRFYDIRSKIVHEGHPGKTGFLDELIYVGLLEISRHILLRYVFLMHLGVHRELPNWVLSDPNALKSRGRRRGAISQILDTAVTHPKLTTQLEKSLEKHGLKEPQQWKHRHVVNVLLPEN